MLPSHFVNPIAVVMYGLPGSVLPRARNRGAQSRIHTTTGTTHFSTVGHGSVQRTPGSLEIRFVVTDFTSDVPVIYDRVLPDLFKENSGVVANGRLNEQGVFVADEVLAKHDENYMPPAVQEALRRGESRLENPPPQPAPQ